MLLCYLIWVRRKALLMIFLRFVVFLGVHLAGCVYAASPQSMGRIKEDRPCF